MVKHRIVTITFNLKLHIAPWKSVYESYIGNKSWESWTNFWPENKSGATVFVPSWVPPFIPVKRFKLF